jgi:hypothetical protein
MSNVEVKERCILRVFHLSFFRALRVQKRDESIQRTPHDKKLKTVN